MCGQAAGNLQAMVKCLGSVLILISSKEERKQCSWSLEGESYVGWTTLTGSGTFSGGLQSAGRSLENEYLAMTLLSLCLLAGLHIGQIPPEAEGQGGLWPLPGRKRQCLPLPVALPVFLEIKRHVGVYRTPHPHPGLNSSLP